METRQSWADITYYKGRYDDKVKPYKEDKTTLVWNVFNEQNGEILPINIFEYNYLINDIKECIKELESEYDEDNE